MGILESMFKWFTAKDKKGNEINLGYVLEGEPRSIQDIETLFKAFKLEKYFKQVKPFIQAKIELRLEPTEEHQFTSARSKIGGQPHLPLNHTWPKNELGKSLSFIGQLNFEEVSQFDQSSSLPKKGLVSFFYCADQEAWGFDPKDRQRFKVLYFEESTDFVKHEFPKDLEEQSIFHSNQIEFVSSLSVPTLLDDTIGGLIEEEDSENYSNVSNGVENQILGYANCIQGPMDLECELVTNGLYCGDSTGYEDPRRKELEKSASDWVLLLQLDSEEEKTNMMWGDCGRIYFWIKKQDLAKKDFDKTWCILQCF